jgi:hypothetical protein
MKIVLHQFQILYFLLLGFFFASSQSKTEIPKNAFFYMEINSKQLNEKVNWNKLNPILQDLNKNNQEKPTWQDFSNIGIQNDAKQYHYFSNFNDSVKAYTAHFILQDSKKFLEFINVSAKKELEVTKKDKYSYVNLNDETFVAWNDKRAVITGVSYTKSYPKFFDDDKAVDSVASALIDSIAMKTDSTAVELDSAYTEVEKPFDYKEEIKYLKDEIKYQKEDIKEHNAEIARLQKDIKYLEKHHQYPPQPKTEEAVESEEVASAKPTEEYDS